MMWDLLQQLQISSSTKSANSALLKAGVTQVQLEQLESQVQTLTLACQAMWELLAKNFGVTEEDLVKKMSEIDLRDGVLDGKLTAIVPTTCPDCNKAVKKTRLNCYWCGAKLTNASPFIK